MDASRAVGFGERSHFYSPSPALVVSPTSVDPDATGLTSVASVHVSSWQICAILDEGELWC